MSMKGAIIGSTQIAVSHINAFSKNGLQIDSIASSQNSESAKKISNSYGLEYFSNSTNLLNQFDKDFLVIASSTDSLLPILKSALNLNTKIFIEKPVTSKSDNLKDIKYKKNIQVGLNRRYYPNFQYFKSQINKNNFYTGNVLIPEPIDFKNFTKNNHKKRIINNAIHVFDLLIYLFGNLKIENIEYIYKQKNKLSVLSFHLYNSKCHIQVQSAANQTLNTQMNFFDGENTYSFLPLEELRVYKGFNVSVSNKINRYKPKQIHSVNAYDRFYKPGFIKQTAVFKKIVAGKIVEKPELKDIVNSLNLIEKIYEQI